MKLHEDRDAFLFMIVQSLRKIHGKLQDNPAWISYGQERETVLELKADSISGR